MKREQQLDQVDRLTRPMELRFAAAYRRFIARLRPRLLANVRAGRAPDAAGSKDKLPRAFASLYRRDITAGRVQADRQIPKKPARKHLPGDHDQQSHAGGGGGEVGGGGARREGGTDWAWAREQHAQRIAADPEAYARERELHEATRLGRDVASMRGGEINRDLDKLERESSKINARLIAEGRGNEKPSETRGKLDILSIEYQNNQDRLGQLRAEVAARYGPNAPSRLPPRVGSKPRKEFKARRRPMSDLEAGATREVGLAGTARLPYATGVTFDVGDLIDASLERLGGTLDTLDDRLELVLADAPDDATDEELADLVEAELDAFEDNGKIEDIAETEVFGSVNGGRAQAFAENEVEWGEWGTMQDNRVRDTHVDLGESGVHPVGFNYAKLVGFGETLLRWPHDVECQEASLVINCRCALLFAEAPPNAEEIYDEEMGDLGEEDKSFVKHLPGKHDQQTHAGDGGGKGDEGGGGTVAGTAGSSGGSSADRIAGATARANTQIRMPEADYDKASEARTEEENRIDNEQAEHSVVLSAAVHASADAQQAADAASAIGNRPEATDADKQAAYESRRALAEAVIEKNNALVKQESFDAQRNELNASMGADYWATHYEKNPDEFETTMDELRGSWRHIGGMTDKVDPIAFRFASQTAFGLDQGVAFDKKEGRFIARSEYSDREGTMTQWAGAMRNEYEDTQEELKSDIEWNGGAGADPSDNYDAWTESDAYSDAYSNAKESAFGDLSISDLEKLVDDGPGADVANEWAIDNLDKLEEHGDDAEPTMTGLVFPDTGSKENPITVEGSLEKLREAGIAGEFDPSQRVIEEDGEPIRQPPSEAELKGVADLKELGEKVDARREEAAELARQAADLNDKITGKWGDNWKNDLWQGKGEASKATAAEKAELESAKDEIYKLNRERVERSDDAQLLANRSESMAVDIMEAAGKWPGGKSNEEMQDELNAEIDTFVGKWAKLAYAKEDPKGLVTDEFSQDFEYDDSADFQDWSGDTTSSGEPMTISPDDWPLEMTRNVDADTDDYVANFAESFALNKEQRMFGSNVLRVKIDPKKVLVFQGAKHWRAVGMGLTEAEFIVLSERPWWVRQKERDEERARQQEEAQIEDKGWRNKGGREPGDVLVSRERRGRGEAERDVRGWDGGSWRDAGQSSDRPGGPEAKGIGSGASARSYADAQGHVKHLPGEHDQQDHAGAGGDGGGDTPKITDDVRGAHHGQVDGTLRATNAQGDVVGFLDYSVFEGRALIQMVEVDPSARRQGIGRDLVARLREEHPEIEWGMMTGEGAALRESIDPGWEKREREQAAARQSEHVADRAEYARLREGFKPGAHDDNDKIQQALDAIDAKYGGNVDTDLRQSKAIKGDFEGHPFRGNQWGTRPADTSPEAGGSEFSGAYERDALTLTQFKAWLLADPFRKDFNPDQPRDEGGQWSSGGGQQVAERGEPGTKPNVKIRMHEGTSERIGKTLGYDPAEVAGVLGLGEAGMAMSGWIYEKEGGLVVAKLRGDGLEVVRTIDAKEGVINNDGFHLDKNHQGKGIGTRILAAQVEEASAKGYTALKTHAVGAAGEVENGYYTWPRLGYDGQIPSDHPFRERASGTQYAKVKRVSDLMKTKGGRDTWKKWGSDIELTFDLKEGSQSREVLAAYMAQRKKN